MDTINLKEQEIAEMRFFYQEELNKTLGRLEHIRSMLEKLGVTNIPAEATGILNEVDKGVQLAGIKKPEKERKRPGRKSEWESLFMGRLKESKRPMTYIQITNAIMAYKKLDKSKFESTKQAVLAVAYRLRARDSKIGTFTIGNREKYVALADWYDSNGFLKQEYKDRIVIGEKVPVEKKAVKTQIGRKPAKRTVQKPAARKRGRPVAN